MQSGAVVSSKSNQRQTIYDPWTFPDWPHACRATDNFATLRKTYGEAHCSLLSINSGNGDRGTVGAPADFYRRFQKGCVVSGGGAGEPASRPPPPSQGLGAHLTVLVSEACIPDPMHNCYFAKGTQHLKCFAAATSETAAVPVYFPAGSG